MPYYIATGLTWNEDARKSRKGRSAIDHSAEYTRVYSVFGAQVATIAEAFAFSIAPSTIVDALTGVYLYKADGYGQPYGTTYEPVSGSAGWGFDVGIVYKDPVVQDAKRQLQVGECRISHQTQGGTLHVTNSLETIKSYISSSLDPHFNAPDLGNAVNVTREGEVHGCDIHVPVSKTTIDYRFPPGIIGVAYADLLDSLVASTNKFMFLTKLSGDVLFAGWSGTNVIANGMVSGPQLSLDFLTSPSQYDIPLGDLLIEFKGGFHYLWTYQKERRAKDSAGADVPLIVKYPAFAYVERMYREEDFDQMGIGDMSTDPDGYPAS